jgi:hypothetical protein
MPFYTAITQEGTVSAETKAIIAEEITRIHTTVMKVLKNFVRSLSLASERVWLSRWRAGPYGIAQLCTAKWAYRRTYCHYCSNQTRALAVNRSSERRLVLSPAKNF